MAIPESQLETWAKQGSVKQSAATYAIVKSALEDSNSGYHNRSFTVFLQGSYGNDTNIYAESDVDVVICYDGAFFHDIANLPPDQQVVFHSVYHDGKYGYRTFFDDVAKILTTAFKSSVKPGNKAIKVMASGSRRNSDVVVAFEYRRYHKFAGEYDQSYDTGICFFTNDGVEIANYPKQHSDNLTAKHAATNELLKPVIRIFKNIRSTLVDRGLIGKGTAPSYFIEGLLYNAPNDRFYGDYSNIVFNILKWLHATTNRDKFVCANEQYYLLRYNSPVCWPTADGAMFIRRTVELWNAWGK